MEYMEDASKQEILDAIGAFAEQVDARFNTLEKDMGAVKFEMGSVKSDMGSMKADMRSMKTEIVSIKSQMVTKNYLDDKLADLRGDLVALTGKMNVKLSVLVETLVKDGSLKRKTADMILAMEPFAQG